jgi:hypothetical protein
VNKCQIFLFIEAFFEQVTQEATFLNENSNFSIKTTNQRHPVTILSSAPPLSEGRLTNSGLAGLRAGVLLLNNLLVPPSDALLFDRALVKIGTRESTGDFLGPLQDLKSHALV